MQTKMDGSLILTNEWNSLNARVQCAARAYEPLKNKYCHFLDVVELNQQQYAKRKTVMDPSVPVHWEKLLYSFALSLSLCLFRVHAGDNFQSVNLNQIQKSRKHPLKKSIEFIPNQSNPKSNTSICAFNFHSLYSAYMPPSIRMLCSYVPSVLRRSLVNVMPMAARIEQTVWNFR